MYSFNKTTQTTSFDLLFLIHLHLLFFLLINVTICPLASHGCYEEERRALLNFKSSLDDPSNRLTSWQEGILHENCCNWHGIGCSDESSRVVSIDLRNTNLENYIEETRYGKGTYNPPNTSLTGSIPFSICSQTQYLDLSSNKLSGIISTGIGYCNSLIYLNLGNNFLTENVPKQLENAKGLLFLQLNDNNLSGTFPNSIEKLLNLEILDLGNNNMEGIIPTGLGLLVGLKILSLRSNNFSGPIPKEIYNLPNLQILDLSINNLSGSILKIGNLRWLLSRPTEKYHFRDPGLDFSEKLMNFQFQFKMVIKGVMRKFEQLYVSSGIDLSCNALEGNIPEEIGQLEGLSMLNLSHNQFSGLIPATVGSMKGLESLDLRDNKLSGLIPQSLASLDFLSYLNLSSNNFSGRIPRGEHFDTLSGDGSVYANNSLLCGFLTNRTCDTDQNSITTDKHVDWLFYSFMALGFGVGFWGPFVVLLIRKEKWWFGYWRLVDIVAVRVTRLVY
ncbi:probably inactive leucine-rich repeat receptor-like protein kinase At2g25790 [Papaver somniferum]|uniref:probably inactive leucine-rich repeat receptor-like protein kinase At2g25790 n=1 Tax=Papaver somniferum TaxID=3469 RepID=UPI000E6F9659|nr:probably inactive leucine-rich repeat receptor-like protein kinase At2g25790 [Papaver somniferum]